MYHFISGYTAKVAGTEDGVTEPEATFSACFGGKEKRERKSEKRWERERQWRHRAR